MKVVLPKAGKYVVAVSGGVDSVALLDVLRTESEIELVVAHFDHGIREDSEQDRLLVQELAKSYELPFAYEEGHLGEGASEAAARVARYDFLRKAMTEHQAQAIVTAHHQDDVLETAIINLLRGSGRKGLTSLSSQDGLFRPLLGVSKQELIAYAKDQGLRWREDSTNSDETYLRNYVRHRLLSKFDETARAKLLEVITDLRETNDELDTLLVNELRNQSDFGVINRKWFIGLPHAVAREVLASWLRLHELRSFDSQTLERLVVAAKVAPAGKQFPVLGGHSMVVKIDNLALDV